MIIIISCGQSNIRPGTVFVQYGSEWLCFSSPRRVIQSFDHSEVLGVLQDVEEAVDHGMYAAGFVTYEASKAFDPAFENADPGSLPLVWFGIYENIEKLADLPDSDEEFSVSEWKSTTNYEKYTASIKSIKDYIASGDTYQVNFTMRLFSEFSGYPWAFFLALNNAQKGNFGAFVDTGSHTICSASPELFFKLSGDKITCRPMKGTAPRGLTRAEDEANEKWLRASEKNRAENVMIVDMIRNDLGRIARPGSVSVPSLFDVERYETVLQMTSTVTAKTDASLSELFMGLFPCASITGAPKVRTMQIINELEDTARGVYTGCIGFVAPNREAQFNVAIRTVSIDKQTGIAEYGTGGGIVWDSIDENEYEECQTKALVLTEQRPSFSLFETMLWKPDDGYFLLERHLNRLFDSARYFSYPIGIEKIRVELETVSKSFGEKPHRVRLLASNDGSIDIQASVFDTELITPWHVSIANDPIDPQNRYLYHKTTYRDVYESAKAGHPDCDDVILWNTQVEVTESTIANVVIRLNGELLTPPVSSGLLPGTFRAHLLDEGIVRESIISLDDLKNAEEIFLVNSLRGWIPAKLS